VAKTLYHLRKLGMPEDTGPDKAVPRAILGYREERGNKKEVLSVYFAKVMAGSLPEYGASENWKSTDVTHEQLAAMHGVRRESWSRRMARCSTGRKRWDEKRREKRSQQMKEKAAADGKKVHNRALRSLEAANGVIFHVTPRFNQACLYSGPTGASGGRDKTKAARLLAERYGEDVFNPSAQVNGFKVIRSDLWHKTLPDPVDCECQDGQGKLAFQQECPRCGGQGWHWREASKLEKERGLSYGALPEYPRLVGSVYIMQGIEDEISEIRDDRGQIVRHHQPPGVLQMRQRDRARLAGMDEDTLRKCDLKLERLGYIRIAPGDKEYWPGTRKVKSSEPDKILWMPGRLLDHEICVQEMERFVRARQALHGHPWLARAEALHLALLKEWEGKPHSLAAFWNELRRRFAHHGVEKSLREALIPVYRE
jgi:hypothetical protein